MKQEYFPEWLENISQSVPEELGVPIEDTLRIPCRQVQNDLAPGDELFVEEKIEAVERPPVFCFELPDFSSFTVVGDERNWHETVIL